MRWYFPSWNGDVRVEAEGETSLVTVVQPTAAEKAALALIQDEFVKQGWLAPTRELWRDADGDRQKPCLTTVQAPLHKVAPVLVKRLKSGQQTLTALVLKDGKVETVTGSEIDLVAAQKAEVEGKAAATVKRPTPCCPECYVEACRPATEALLDFLDPEQHASWKRHRYVIVEGRFTGHRYLLAHRHSPRAERQGRMCADIDDNVVVHFHDWSVPPEEEVLAAKLVLEHQEHWLRNEATMLEGGDCVFKNPFGDDLDGTPGASLTRTVGGFVQGLVWGIRTAQGQG